jgi:hypothetical protein
VRRLTGLALVILGVVLLTISTIDAIDAAPLDPAASVQGTTGTTVATGVVSSAATTATTPLIDLLRIEQRAAGQILQQIDTRLMRLEQVYMQIEQQLDQRRGGAVRRAAHEVRPWMEPPTHVP